MNGNDELIRVFASRCSKETFAAAVAERVQGDRWAQQRLVVGAGSQGVLAAIQYLHAAGRILPVAGVEGHDIDFVARWQRLVDGDWTEDHLGEKHQFHMAVNHLSRAWVGDALMTAVSSIVNGGEPGHAVDVSYDTLVETVVAGKLELWASASQFKCEIDGETYDMHMEDWQPKLVRFDAVSKLNVPIEPYDGSPKP